MKLPIGVELGNINVLEIVLILTNKKHYARDEKKISSQKTQYQSKVNFKVKILTWFGSSLVIAIIVNTNPKLIWVLKKHLWSQHVSKRISTDSGDFKFFHLQGIPQNKATCFCQAQSKFQLCWTEIAILSLYPPSGRPTIRQEKYPLVKLASRNLVCTFR